MKLIGPRREGPDKPAQVPQPEREKPSDDEQERREKEKQENEGGAGGPPRSDGEQTTPG